MVVAELDADSPKGGAFLQGLPQPKLAVAKGHVTVAAVRAGPVCSKVVAVFWGGTTALAETVDMAAVDLDADTVENCAFTAGHQGSEITDVRSPAKFHTPWKSPLPDKPLRMSIPTTRHADHVIS